MYANALEKTIATPARIPDRARYIGAPISNRSRLAIDEIANTALPVSQSVLAPSRLIHWPSQGRMISPKTTPAPLMYPTSLKSPPQMLYPTRIVDEQRVRDHETDLTGHGQEEVAIVEAD